LQKKTRQKKTIVCKMKGEVSCLNGQTIVDGYRSNEIFNIQKHETAVTEKKMFRTKG
jgi:hypothetical protein